VAWHADCRPRNRQPSDCISTFYNSNLGILESLTFKFKICLSGYLWSYDLLSFCGHLTDLQDSVVGAWRCLNDARQSFSVTKTGDRRVVVEEVKRVYDWVTGFRGSVVLFACRPLVHVCRMVERRAHRKEFRRKEGWS